MKSTNINLVNSIESVKSDLLQAADLLNRFIKDEVNINKIVEASELMVEAIQQEKKIISCGNGGSHCDAMHFAEELTGKYRTYRKALPALAITNPSHLTCVGNDYGFEQVFSRFIEGLGKKGDVLLAISTSGNSQNICKAIEIAKEKSMYTIGLTGNDEGEVGKMVKVHITVPYKGFTDRIQEMHGKIIHILVALIERALVNHHT